jgi:hypothetical protein
MCDGVAQLGGFGVEVAYWEILNGFAEAGWRNGMGVVGHVCTNQRVACFSLLCSYVFLVKGLEKILDREYYHQAQTHRHRIKLQRFRSALWRFIGLGSVLSNRAFIHLKGLLISPS